jgi:RNA polymerase sigma factor for flagellar operon FliA
MVNITLNEISNTFRAFADPTRRSILQSLAKNPNTSLTELAQSLGISVPAISKHLNVLSSVGLVNQRKEEIERSVNLKLLDDLIFWLQEFTKNLENQLGSDDDIKLWKRYRETRSPDLRESLTKKYLFLVKYVVGRIAPGLSAKIPFDDLISYGLLGLFDAIEKYDVRQGGKFETFAVCTIRKAILHELKRQDWTPRLLRKKEWKTEEKTGASIQARKSMAISPDWTELLHHSTRSNRSAWVKEDEDQVFVNLHEVFNNAHANRKSSTLKEDLARALDSLPEREKLMFVLYYYENLTLREIAEVLNVSEARVCQIHTRVVMQLRNKLVHGQ